MAIDQQQIYVHMRNRANHFKTKSKPPSNNWKPFNAQWKTLNAIQMQWILLLDEHAQELLKQKTSSQEEHTMNNA
jgi:hypothetical protein